MGDELGRNGAFVLGPARCGSTMLSGILNAHPDILSLSEFLTYLGPRALLPGQITGTAYWKRLSRQTCYFRKTMTPDTAPHEFLYNRVGGRYPVTNVPPLLATTLPHLSDDPDSLFDALAESVPFQPRQTMEAHHAALFDCLRERCGGRIWVERSGLSLVYARAIPQRFPLAKIVFLSRDGRDVALSYQAFPPARPIIWNWIAFRKFGFNPIDMDRPLGRSRLLAFYEKVFTPVSPIGWMLRTPPPLKACAAFWSEMILAAMPEIAALPTARRHVLGFERLTSEPRAEIDRLVRFFGVAAPADWLDAAARIPVARPPSWKRLPPDQQHELSDWTAQARAAIATLL